MPRRHISSAAGALAAALLFAVQAPSNAQDADDRPWRGSIGLPDGPAAPLPPVVVPVDQGQSVDGVEPIGGEGLGGMGDDGPGASTPLERVGEEPSDLEAETIVLPEDGIGLTPPTRAISAIPQVHSALLPEPHDLDPFVPIGIRIGSFLIFPEAEAGVAMTNNVLATRFDARSDAGPQLTPKIRVDSDWGRHYLGFEANADRIWYSEFPIADTKNYQVLTRGRLDMTRRTHFFGEIEKSRVQEGPSSISLTDIATSGTTALDEQHATAAFEHRFNRLTVRLTGTVADYNYSDTGNTTVSGDIPFDDIRDYQEILGTLRSTYEFQPRWAGFIETSLNERKYQEPVAVEGFRRGSTGYTAMAGVNLRLAGTVFGEIAAGWGEQQPIDDEFANISGPLINGNLIWMATPSTKFEFLARSGISETSLDTSAGAVDHFFQLGLQQSFWRYLVLGVYSSYEVADYAGISQVDQRTKLGATAEYYFNPLMSAYARYEHTDFTSSPDISADFIEDEIRIGLKFRR